MYKNSSFSKAIDIPINLKPPQILSAADRLSNYIRQPFIIYVCIQVTKFIKQIGWIFAQGKMAIVR